MRGLPLILLPFVLAGCALTGGGGPAPEVARDDGLTRYEISAGDFSIAVPDTWRVTTSEQIRKRGLHALLHDNPALATLVERSRSKFIAFDPYAGKSFAASVVVSVSPEKRGTAAKFKRAVLAHANAAAAGKVRASDVALPAGAGVRLAYKVGLVVHGRKRPVSAVQYAFLARNTGYVLTYVTLPSYEGEYEYTFKRSATSFRLTKG